MNILLYPNASLERVCEPVTEFSDSLRGTLKEMEELMLGANGLGLSANQVGINKRFFIIKDNKGIVHHMINPKLLEIDGMSLMNEGCLSFPGLVTRIARPESVVLEYQTADGEQKKIMAEGLEARAIQHELEHLDGKIFLNNLNRQQRRQSLKMYEKSRK